MSTINTPKLTDRVKGVMHAMHGSGEIARGMINNVLDGLGDGVADRRTNEVTSKHPRNINVVVKGKEELARGMKEMKGQTVIAPVAASDHVVETRRTSAGGNGVFAAVEDFRLKFNKTIDDFGNQIVNRPSSTSAAPLSSARATHSSTVPVAASQSLAQLNLAQPTGWTASIASHSASATIPGHAGSTETVHHSVPPVASTSQVPSSSTERRQISSTLI